ncbi:MAG: hypothetical protein RR138_07280 [Akkermansia sp.]
MKPLNFSNFLGNKHSTTLSEKMEFIHSDTLVRVEENCPGFRIATRYPSHMKISRHSSDRLFGNRKQSEDSRRMWSRHMTKISATSNRHRYNPSRGYLQIVDLDKKRSTLNTLWLLHWDPTESIAIRPLSIRKGRARVFL